MFDKKFGPAFQTALVRTTAQVQEPSNWIFSESLTKIVLNQLRQNVVDIIIPIHGKYQEKLAKESSDHKPLENHVVVDT
jgi:hypothetical protein